jgi:small-conductance mechanosensitive channel
MRVLGMEVMTLLVPAAVVVGGILAGIMVRQVVLRRLEVIARRTTSEWDDVILRALRGPLLGWFVVLGLYVAAEVATIPASAQAVVQKLLVVLIIGSVTWTVARLGATLVRGSMGAAGQVPSASLIENIVRVTIGLVGVLVALQSLGISVTPIITALGVGGLAVALALQDTLANFFAGIHILASRKIRPGDFVQLESGERGVVEDIAWRHTTIRQLPNLLTVVPNAKLASAVVTNCSLPDPETAVLVTVGVSYGSDLAHVERVTIEVAREVMRDVEGGVPAFEPFIRYNEFGDSSVNFTAILRGKEFTSQFLVKHEFIKRLHARYSMEGIEIPFPQRVVHLPAGASDAAR